MNIKAKAARALSLLLQRYAPRVAYRYLALRARGLTAIRALRQALLLRATIRPCTPSDFHRALALPGVNIRFTKSNGVIVSRAGKVLGMMTGLCSGRHFLDTSAFA
ncbi:hypothetical protein BJP27_24550 (plasmid) [Pseudomonas oryzihabitans]|nr:hypothetical protein BJP27_23900 [Pseudomonas psychrotolerans]APQ14742.1 hypothetical protein BJP27_24550 [Pseudomonas psychrotolerans]